MRLVAEAARFRPCEERRDEAIQYRGAALDCFAFARNDGLKKVFKSALIAAA
jgi:hypothetical protein